MKCNKASTDMRELVLELGGPIQGSENRKSWFARIARTAGISRRSASAAFYGEIRGETHRAGVEAKLRAALAQHQKTNNDDITEIKNRIAALERRLLGGDQDFYQPSIDAIREVARAAGGKGGSIDA